MIYDSHTVRIRSKMTENFEKKKGGLHILPIFQILLFEYSEC